MSWSISRRRCIHARTTPSSRRYFHMVICWARLRLLGWGVFLRGCAKRVAPSAPLYRLQMGSSMSSQKRHRRGAEAFVETVERVALALRQARQHTPHVLSDAYEAEAREHTSSLIAILKALDEEDLGFQRWDLELSEDSVDDHQSQLLTPGQWPEECNWPVRPIQYVYGAEYPGLFSVGVFVLPRGAYLPLHDHFGMVVVSRVLWGSLLMRALDFYSPSSTDYQAIEHSHREGGWAQTVVERCERRAGDTWALYPKSGGNVHEIVALDEPCGMLDIILPPYPAPSVFKNRNGDHELYECHYYRTRRPHQTKTPDGHPLWFLERFPGDDLVYVQRARQRFLPGLWRIGHR